MSYEEIKELFPEWVGDTLKVDVDDYLAPNRRNEHHQFLYQWNGAYLSAGDFRNLGPFEKDGYALGRVQLKDDCCGFLYALTDHKEIRILIYSESRQKMLLDMELAHYDYVETTYKSEMKSWLLDIDGDGDTDIANWESLTDYELPNEYSDNISGDTRYMHMLENDSLVYYYWDYEKLEGLRFR